MINKATRYDGPPTEISPPTTESLPTALEDKLRRILESVYLSGWHDTAPDYDSKELIDSLAKLTSLVNSELEAKSKELLQKVYDFPKGRYKTDTWDIQMFVKKLQGQLTNKERTPTND